MTTTPRLGMTDLVNGQATPESRVNQNVRTLEAFGNCTHFKSRANNMAQPGSPADGDCYLLTGTPTGTNWAGQGGKVALFLSSSWLFFTAKEGFIAWVDDEDVLIGCTGGGWSTLSVGTPASEASNAEVWAGASSTKFLSPNRLFASAAPVALTSGATITPDGNSGYNFSLTIGTNATLANPTNFKVGQSGVIVITQDGTGGRTLAYGTNWKFPGGSPVLSTAAGAIDTISYFVAASGVILCNLAKAYS